MRIRDRFALALAVMASMAAWGTAQVVPATAARPGTVSEAIGILVSISNSAAVADLVDNNGTKTRRLFVINSNTAVKGAVVGERVVLRYAERRHAPLALSIIGTTAQGDSLSQPENFGSDTKGIRPIQVTQRIALVIGNSNYKYEPSIAQAANDADDIAAVLRQFGFDVTEISNVSTDKFDLALRSFYDKIQGDALAVFYYSGHGGSVGEENYLLPIEFEPPEYGDPVNRHAVNISTIRRHMEESKAAVRLLIFDACRDAILVRGNKGISGGFVKMEGEPNGTLIAYASADGQPAKFDKQAHNSLYSAELLNQLRAANTDVETLLRTTADSVYRATGHLQMPYIYGHLFDGKVYLRANDEMSRAPDSDKSSTISKSNPLSRPEPDATLLPTDAAKESWKSLKHSTNPKDFDLFASSFPHSELAVTASIRAEQLRELKSEGLSVESIQNALSWEELKEADYELKKDLARLDDPPDLASYCDDQDAQSLNLQGWKFQHGMGFDKNSELAFVCYTNAAKANDRNGMNSLGMACEQGIGTEKDPDQALLWYRKAAEAGSTEGMMNLARMYQLGVGVAQDRSQAFSWYKKAAEAGSAAGMYRLAICYHNGIGIATDLKMAFTYYKKAAEAGNADGMNELGWAYQERLSAAENPEMAFTWYLKAAEAGHGAGMNNLGRCYENGYGVSTDPHQAFTWYLKSAVAGNSDGMNSAGRAYESGLGVGKDLKSAVYWYTKAAAAGNSDGMDSLGRVYENGGIGVERNLDLAITWYRKAAALGNSDAEYKLGQLR